MLFALGLDEQVVAVSHECDWPPEVARLPRATRSNVDSSRPSREIDVEVKRLLARGNPLYEVDRQLVETLRPDLIVTQSQCDVCAVRHADVLRLVSDSPALRATAVVDLNPQSLDDVLADLGKIARAAGVPEAGELCVAALKLRIAIVKALVSSAPRPRVALIEWIEPLMLAGNWMPQLVDLAGGENLLTRLGEHSPYVAWDALAAADPQVLVVTPCGFDLDRSRVEAQVLRKRPEWGQLAAVREGRAFVVDGNAYFNRSGPRLVESLEILAHLLHPDRVPPPHLPHPGWKEM